MRFSGRWWGEPSAEPQAAVRLTNRDDVYNGSDMAETIIARGGDDQVFARGGNDVLYGNRGNDRLDGNKGSDSLYGGEGDDTLMGNQNRDFLDGGDGGDVLNGGTQRDVLIGGLHFDSIYAGSTNLGDTFESDGARDLILYRSAAEAPKGELILNFGHLEDKVDLSAIDANPATPEDDAFHFIRDAAFSGTPGELRAVPENGGLFQTVYADLDGDKVADMTIQIDTSDRFIGHRDFIL